MGWFKKRQGTIDFTKLPDARVHQKEEFKLSGNFVDLRNQNSSESSQTSSNPMDFLNTIATSSNSSGSNIVTQVSEMSELKHKMRTITGKIEDNSNELYRLLHRIELLERKIEKFENR